MTDSEEQVPQSDSDRSKSYLNRVVQLWKLLHTDVKELHIDSISRMEITNSKEQIVEYRIKLVK
jgi:hypothetical protein